MDNFSDVAIRNAKSLRAKALALGATPEMADRVEIRALEMALAVAEGMIKERR
jgi:hypothetical protein